MAAKAYNVEGDTSWAFAFIAFSKFVQVSLSPSTRSTNRSVFPTHSTKILSRALLDLKSRISARSYRKSENRFVMPLKRCLKKKEILYKAYLFQLLPFTTLQNIICPISLIGSYKVLKKYCWSRFQSLHMGLELFLKFPIKDSSTFHSITQIH